MSRLKNSSQNGIVTLFFFVVNTLFGFVSRKVMLECIGLDLLGLNTTLSAIIDFMLLMELGISSAIGVSLYKPISNNDTDKINHIMWLIRYIYKYITLGVIVLGVLFSPFLPLFITSNEVTLTQAYIAYVVFLVSSASGYFLGYGRVLFQADQKTFITTTITSSIIIAKIGLQIIVVYLTHSYWWWLVIELFFQVSSHLAVKRYLYKKYNYLSKTPEQPFRSLSKLYPDIFYNAKRIAIHQLAGFVLKQSDNLVIAGMISLSMVAMYGNYYMINIALNGLIYSMLYTSWSSVGNLVATESRERIYEVYKQYLSVSFFIVAVVNICFIFLVDDFIRIWFGAEYILGFEIVIGLAGVNLIGGFTNASAAFNSAYKLFNDVAVPIIETILNIAISIVGAYYYGLIGVICGTFISILISSVWKPIYLHKKGVKMPLKPFYFQVLRIWTLFLIGTSAVYFGIYKPFQLYVTEITNIWQWFLWGFVILIGTIVVLGLLMIIGDKNFRVFVYTVKKKLIR